MFFNVKKTQVGWYIDDDVLSHPSLNIEPSVDSTFGCPSIASMVNRYYNVYPQFDAEISFGFKDDKPYYEYKIGKQMNTTNFVHDLIKSRIGVRVENNKVVMQITDNKLFVTDDVNLEMILLRPETVNYSNASFINGSFYPYGWIRSLNSAYIQDDSKKFSTVYVDRNNPYFNLLFSNKVDLSEIKPNQKILDYASNSIGMVNYHKNVKPVMNKVIKKRPKYLLK